MAVENSSQNRPQARPRDGSHIDEFDRVRVYHLTPVQRKIVEVADIVAKRHLPYLSPITQVMNGAGEAVPIIDTMRGGSSEINPLQRGRQEAANHPLTQQRMQATKASNDPKVLYSTPIRELLDLFAGNIVAVGQAMVDAATGYKVLRRDPETGQEIEVYEKEPDAKIGELIISRLMGKPEVSKTVEHTGNAGANVHIYIPDNTREIKPTGRTSTPDLSNEPTNEPEPTPPLGFSPEGAKATGWSLPNRNPAPYAEQYEDYTDTADILDEEYNATTLRTDPTAEENNP